jgi:4-amino-4-deoxychorismate lyase
MPAQGEIRDGNDAGLALIETLRWEPEAGFVRLDRHLARLENSANVLGFNLPVEVAKRQLQDAIGGATPLRVRLELAWDGAVQVATQPFAPLVKDAVWQLKIATTRLASGNPLLRHKTTRREIYDAARAEFSREEADEVILLNERGEVCEGTITNIFVDTNDGGPLLTPAVECGLLPGVLRAEMIEQGQAKEAILTVDDLHTAKAVHVGNSLRGLITSRVTIQGD